MTNLIRSWVASANDAETPFPVNNLPYGVFSTAALKPRCGVAIGDKILDMAAAEAAGLVRMGDAAVFDAPAWNGFMALGPAAWEALRARLIDLITEGAGAG